LLDVAFAQTMKQYFFNSVILHKKKRSSQMVIFEIQPNKLVAY